MNLKIFINTLRQWFWLIVLVAIASGGLSYLAFRSEVLLYRASSTMQIGTYPILVHHESSLALARTNFSEDFITKSKMWHVLLDAVIQKTTLPLENNELAELIQVEHLPNTSLVRVTVTFRDSSLAAVIANALTAELIAISAIKLTPEQQDQLIMLQRASSQGNEELIEAREELKRTEARLNSVAQEKVELIKRQGELMKGIKLIQKSLAQTSYEMETLTGITNCCAIRIVEPALIPRHPINPSPFIRIPAIILISTLLTCCVVLGFEYLKRPTQSPTK